MEGKEQTQTCIRPEDIAEDDIRLRALHMLQILQEETDEEHPISTSKLMQLMEERYSTTMHRTRVPLDLSALTAAGYDVRAKRTQVYNYYYDGWQFDVAELKILIDAVQSSKFISEKRSRELIDKLASMTSKWNADGLKRSVAVPGRVKNDGKNVFTLVDTLHRAINEEKKISFHYYRFDSYKHKVLTNDGAPYIVSPYNLIWDGDYYYVVGYCDNRGEMRTFRVDRILNVPDVLEEVAVKKPKGFRITRYTNDAFRMYAGQESVEVTLKCNDHMMNAVIDKFGRSVKTIIYGDGTFAITVPVCLGPTFYRWIFGTQGGIRILGPQNVKDEYRLMLNAAQENL